MLTALGSKFGPEADNPPVPVTIEKATFTPLSLVDNVTPVPTPKPLTLSIALKISWVKAPEKKSGS